MKECLNCSDNSSTKYSRCEPLVSTNCTFYQGVNLTCPSDETFSVCKGQNLSVVQETLFNKICELSGEIDVTEIRFPCSLQEAWRNEDPTLFNLLNYFATIACEQKATSESLQTQINDINPIVDICLQCCGDDCGSTKLVLSDALNRIVQCLCDAKAQINGLTKQVNLLQGSYNTLLTQIDLLKEFQTSQILLNIDLQTRLLAVENKLTCDPCE